MATVDEQGATFADHLGGKAAQSCGRNGLGLAAVNAIGHGHGAGLDIDHPDLQVPFVAERLTHLVAHRDIDAVHVQLPRQGILNRIDHRQLSIAGFGFLQQPLGFVEQAGVFQRDTCARGEGLQQANVGFTEGLLAFIVIQVEHADDPIAGKHRYQHLRLGQSIDAQRHGAQASGHSFEVAVSQQGLARAQDFCTESTGRDDGRFDRPAVHPEVGKVHQTRRWVIAPNADAEVREHLSQLLTHRVVHRLQVELSRQCALHGVDQSQLGVAGFGLFQQPLRLVEQTRVLHRHRHAAGQRLQQAHVGLVEGMLAVHVVQGQHQPGFARDHHRHQQLRSRLSAQAGHDHAAQRSGTGRQVFVDEQGLAGAHHLGGEAEQGRFEARHIAAAVGQLVGVADLVLGAVDDPDGDALLAKDLGQFVADDHVDVGQVQPPGQRGLHRVDDRQLGVAGLGLLQQALGFVEQPGVLERCAHRRR
mmetsp:Transcript_891/g.2090  ORF Transcript_891/g.2090 Transcript_891/m.2090 type:complete len:474 (+) Transcript_891:285-1706(+)